MTTPQPKQQRRSMRPRKSRKLWIATDDFGQPLWIGHTKAEARENSKGWAHDIFEAQILDRSKEGVAELRDLFARAIWDSVGRDIAAAAVDWDQSSIPDREHFYRRADACLAVLGLGKRKVKR